MAGETSSQGTKFYIGDGASPEVFTQVENVLSIDPLEATVGTIDVTHADSTAREYISDQLPDGAEISVECSYVADAPGQLLMQGAFKKKVNFKLTYGDDDIDPTEVLFSAAIVRQSLPGYTQGEQNKISWGLKISGPITFAE